MAKKAAVMKPKKVMKRKESVFDVSTRVVGDPAGGENARKRWRATQKSKQRNAARKEWRKAHPTASGQPSGRQLNMWPLPA